MDKTTVKISVFFSDPFWVGTIERTSEGRLTVGKITFGAEPKDYEVQDFLMKNYDRIRFSPSVDSEKAVKEHVNPKRMQRAVKRQLSNVGIGTKSQQALKLLQEEGKLERKVRTKEQKEAEKEFQFELKQQKRKEKHRGR